ncbi:MAG: protoheme IX farnesyltransferase [Crenarchaeota archaeon]|nr:protoheme IX farnesyltransferase [Thermoproteota archaeon]
MQKLATLVRVLDGLIKFRQTLLLTASMYAAFLVAGGYAKPLQLHVTILLLGFLSIAATTAVNMFFDRDIDAMMNRTAHRPLPRGVVEPRIVLYVSVMLVAICVAAGAIYVNQYFAASIAAGFFFDIVAYTLLLKRRTPLSIVAGSLAGGAPSFGGWAAARGAPGVGALAFSMLIVAWVPAHIWFLALYYRDDYRAANVPMLPVITGPATVGVAVAFASIFQAYSVAILYASHDVGLAPLVYGILASLHTFKLSMDVCSGKPEYMRAFKLVNMHLGILLIIMMLDAVLGRPFGI